MAHDVFMCHASQDRAIAQTLVDGLERRGIGCWIAPRDVMPGADYAQAIVNGISGARALVLVFSRHSNESPHVSREVERAVSHDLHVVPYRVENVTPSGPLEYFISNAQWLDATGETTEGHIEELARVIRIGVYGEKETTPRTAARDALRRIINRYGQEVMDDSRRVQALLRDMAGEHRAEVAAMVAAAEEGVGPALLQSSDPSGTQARMTQRLVDNRGLRADVAEWAVASWAFSLGIPTATVPPEQPAAVDLDATVPATAAEDRGQTSVRGTRSPAVSPPPTPPAFPPAPATAPPDSTRAPTSKLAVWALVLAAIFWGVGSIAGIIMGRRALKQIDGSEGRIGGRSYARAAIIVGWVTLGLVLLAGLFEVLSDQAEAAFY